MNIVSTKHWSRNEASEKLENKVEPKNIEDELTEEEMAALKKAAKKLNKNE